MAKKIIAYYKTKDEYKAIDIFSAIKLENSLIKNKDDDIVFWDTPEEEKAERIHTVRSSKNGRGAHFSYYPHSTRVGISSDMSMTHRLYGIVLAEEKVLELYQFGERIKIYVASAKPDLYYQTKYNQYYLDILLILEKTEPNSYFYKWGGKLVIEIWVTHKVDKSKANDLEQSGLQVFELKVYPNQRIPNEIVSEREYDYYKHLVMKRVKNDKLVGRLINNVIPETGTLMEMRYKQLADYEGKVIALKKEIEVNQIKVKEMQDRIAEAQVLLDDLNEQCVAAEKKLKKTKKTIGNVNDIINERNKYKNKYKKEYALRLGVEEELKNEREKSIFSRLLKRK